MTDKEKLDKLVAEIERLIDKKDPNTYLGVLKIEAYKDVLSLIDSMRKEPKECMYSKDDYTDEDRKVLCEDCKGKCAYAIAGVILTNAQIKKWPVSEEQVKESLIYRHEDKTCKEKGNSLTQEPVSIDFEQELYKAFGQVKDFTLSMRIAKWFYDMGKNSQEPVSEELEKEIDSYFAKWLQGSSDEGCFNPDSQLVSIYDCHRIARHFANWQKQKNKSKFLTEEQCRKIRDDAFELGKDAMKQKMMAKAVDVEVKVDAGGYPYIPQMELYNYEKDIPLAKEGDKYKVILIKEG